RDHAATLFHLAVTRVHLAVARDQSTRLPPTLVSADCGICETRAWRALGQRVRARAWPNAGTHRPMLAQRTLAQRRGRWLLPPRAGSTPRHPALRCAAPPAHPPRPDIAPPMSGSPLAAPDHRTPRSSRY